MLVIGWQLLIGAFCILGVETFSIGELGGTAPITAETLLDAMGVGYLAELASSYVDLPFWLLSSPLWPLLCLIGGCFAAIGHLRLCRGYAA